MMKDLRVIIAGSRHITNYAFVVEAIEASGWASEITEVVCGCAIGVDTLGARWAEERGIQIEHFPPNYGEYSSEEAPKKRNTLMAKYGDRLILIPGPKSRGSWDMLNKIKALKKPFFVRAAK